MWWLFYASGSFGFMLFCLFVLGCFLLSVLLTEGLTVFLSWEIASSAGVSVDFSVVLDWVSVSFGCVVLLISSCVMIFSCEYMSEEVFLPRFSWLVLLFVLSMSFVIFIPNLVAILLGWDGLGLVSFLLVIYYQNFKSLSGGMLTVLMNRVGDVMILVSIGLLSCEGSYSLFHFSVDSVLWLVCFLLLLAGMTKSAQIPFSSWLPAAMAAPTPVSALVHSSTLVTAGVFLLIRFFYYLSSVWWFKPLLLLIAVSTMIMAGISANLETDLKKIIALSTLSQLGVMMTSLGLGAWKLALFHLYTHAMFKALLFLCAGAMIHRFQHGQDLRFTGLVWGRIPIVVSCFQVSNMALCGAPFLAGFYSKDMILESSLYFDGNFITLVMIFLATGMTVSYSVRVSISVLWSDFSFYSCHSIGGEELCEVVPMTVLMLGAVFGGSAFMWMIFYGEGLIYLSFLNKLLTLTSVGAGAFIGWIVSNMKVLSEGSKFGFTKSYFGLVYMWFLVHLTSQGLVRGNIKAGSSALYSVDRGWSELLGGSGAFGVVKKVVYLSQGVLLNSILVYVSLTLFLVVSLLSLFLMS